MGKILALVLGLAVVAGVAYQQIKGSLGTGTPATPGSPAKSAPKQRLDDMRQTADRIGQEAQERAEDMMKKTE